MDHGRRLLQSVKAAAAERSFAIDVGAGLRLRPIVTTSGAQDKEELRCLTTWRNRHVRAFLHEFAANEARTARWLATLIGPDDTRILFSLVDDSGQMVGYLGLAYIDWARGYGEADAIVRGEPLPAGTMKRALTRLLAWARSDLGLSELGVRVLSDNAACRFYERCGFVEQRREPLAARTTDDGIIWEPTSAQHGARYLVLYRYAAP